jgi:hypothetical protein
MVSEAFSIHTFSLHAGLGSKKVDVATAAAAKAVLLLSNQATRNFTVLFPFFLSCVQVAAVKSSGGASTWLDCAWMSPAIAATPTPKQDYPSPAAMMASASLYCIDRVSAARAATSMFSQLKHDLAFIARS